MDTIHIIVDTPKDMLSLGRTLENFVSGGSYVPGVMVLDYNSCCLNSAQNPLPGDPIVY